MPADAAEKELLTQRYAGQIVGILGCWHRVIITGTLTEVCHTGAVEGWLRRNNIRCFDLKVFAEALWDQVRDHLEGTPTEKDIFRFTLTITVPPCPPYTKQYTIVVTP